MIEYLPCGIINGWFKMEFAINSATPTDSEGNILFELMDSNCVISIIKFDWESYPTLIETINNGLNLTKSNLILFENGIEISKFTINENKVIYESDINWFTKKYNINPCERTFRFVVRSGIVNTVIYYQPKCECRADELTYECPPEKNHIKSINFNYEELATQSFNVNLEKGLCCNDEIKVQKVIGNNITGLEFTGHYLNSPDIDLDCLIIPINNTNIVTININYDGSSQSNLCTLDYLTLIFYTECGGKRLSSTVGPIQIKISKNNTDPCFQPPQNIQAVYLILDKRFSIKWDVVLGAQKYVLNFFNKNKKEVFSPNFNGITTSNTISILKVDNLFHRDINGDINFYIEYVIVNAICSNGVVNKTDYINIIDDSN